MANKFENAVQLIQQGDWHAAHEIVQSGRDQMSCWIHAWLHRQEGDNGNAGYWYSLAGKEIPESSLEDELITIAEEASKLAEPDA